VKDEKDGTYNTFPRDFVLNLPQTKYLFNCENSLCDQVTNSTS